LVVHNKTDYQLTHLLEHGHVKRNGERFNGEVHIRPNEEKAIREYLRRIERALEP
jgi:type II secretory pathway predicted ATPase ExeA